MEAEYCLARSVEQDAYLLGGGYIGEWTLPADCMRCIQRALNGDIVSVRTTNTYDEGLATLKEWAGEDVQLENADMWRTVALKEPGDTVERELIEETGFDIRGDSYDQSSTTQTRTIVFNCQQ